MMLFEWSETCRRDDAPDPDERRERVVALGVAIVVVGWEVAR